MSPFDDAWRLLKMPIVPNSYTQPNPYNPYYHRADFEMPDIRDKPPNQRGPLSIFYSEEERPIYAGKRASLQGNYNPETKEFDIRMLGLDSPYGKKPQLPDDIGLLIDNPQENYRQLSTHGSARRHGVATAMMDMLSFLREKYGFEPVKPTENVTTEGTRFWGDRESWPVRDEL